MKKKNIIICSIIINSILLIIIFYLIGKPDYPLIIPINEVSIEEQTEFWNMVMNKCDYFEEIEKNDNISEVNKLRNDMIGAVMAYQVEKIVDGASSDQEKSMRIAKWIAANISNREIKGTDTQSWYASRAGLCGNKVMLFVEMLKYQNIPSRVFNIYNFGGVGGGHSAVQVYYDNGWHYFDVMYAGFFMKNSTVISWEEIISDPEGALKNMVVFENTLDRWGNLDEDLVDRPKVSNTERMKNAYNIKTLSNARSYGFYQYEDVKVLYPQINGDLLNKEPIIIGEIDSNFNDVTIDGIEKNLSEQMGVSLGTGTDTFHTAWEFENLIPNKKYAIRYFIYKSNLPNLEFWAKSNDAQITTGTNFVSTKELVEGNLKEWTITFIPKDEKATVTVGYDFQEKQKALLPDMISIELLR